MTCHQWKDTWVAHLYGELDEEERNQLTAHLDRCGSCRRRLEELAEARRRLHTDVPAVPSRPRSSILLRRNERFGWWSFAAGLACGALVFGLGFLAGSRGDRTAPAVSPAAREAASGDVDRLEQRLVSLEDRLERWTAATPERLATREQMESELQALERRFDRRRAEDVRFLIRSITDTELRTGTWIDETRRALTYLALQQDPRANER